MKKNKNGVLYTRYITVTAMLSAIAFVLMYLEFSVPFMPSFIAMDFSDLPELIGAFAMGPVCGVLICFIKNVLHLVASKSAFIGELSNFLLGAAFVLPAGLIYKIKKTKNMAFIASFAGVVSMGIVSVISNYFLIYPLYYKVGMAKEVILSAYQAIAPGMQNILQCILCFNLPFTIVKGLIISVITMIIYKPISPILKGRH